LKGRLKDSAIDVVDVTLPPAFDGLTNAQCTIMDFEVSLNLKSRCEKNPELVSRSLMELLKRGALISDADYSAAVRIAAGCRAMLPDVLDTVDALVVPAAIGEAPRGQATGDPVFCRSWTLLHCPVITLPLLHGPSGLPIGVQLVSGLHSDDRLLETARTLMALDLAA
jgi:Asp-tRNA(Asn)/Glu-tRNA(Gln) amidotransferase A subunit family amidase